MKIKEKISYLKGFLQKLNEETTSQIKELEALLNDQGNNAQIHSDKDFLIAQNSFLNKT